VYSKEFIQEIPKSDLHVHLDGSLRLPTLIELAKEQSVTLPSYTPEGLMETVFKENYKDLPEYLQGFAYTCAVMRDAESLERIAYEFALDNAAEGVYYVEVRFGPYLHVHEKLDVETVLGSVYRGMERAKKEINKTRATSGLPRFEYGIIASNLRMFSAESSAYYKKIMDALAWLPQKEIFAQASLQLARAAVDIRDRKGYPIVGFDLAGAEYDYVDLGDPVAASAAARRISGQPRIPVIVFPDGVFYVEPTNLELGLKVQALQ
jgi:adenosine deaminase